jgi:beta-lactamase class D
MNNVKVDYSLKTYFDSAGVKGCFGYLTEIIISLSITCPDIVTVPYSASTFKIVNSLIGIQTGVIRDENMVIKWDGAKRWNGTGKKISR